MNLRIEKYYWKKGYKMIIGLDEAGRGSLVGPVAAAAATIYPPKFSERKLRRIHLPKFSERKLRQVNFQEILKKTKDSKQLTPKQRENIFKLIKKTPEMKFSCSFIEPRTIDKININKATQKAMQNCLQKILKSEVKNIKNKKILILVDGNQPLSFNYSFLKNKKIFQKTIIKGDSKIFSIALASIIAKVSRDKKMNILSLKYPRYKFSLHKGYPTKLHRRLLKKYGPCKMHRRSYKLLND